MDTNEITGEEAHDIIRILCKGSANEAEYKTYIMLLFQGMTEESANYYWNTYHAVMTSRKILGAIGVHGDDLEKALQEIGEFFNEQAPEADKPKYEDNVRPIK